MIRRTLLASVLTLSSAVAFTSAASAAGTPATADVLFAGTVLSVCAFVPTPGVLMPADNSTALDSSTAASGTAGIAVLTCNTKTNLTVDAPVQTAGPTFKPTAASASVSGNGLNTLLSTLTGTAVPVALPIGVTTLNVNMRVEKGSLLDAGAYGYTVRLTATPQ